MFKIIPIHEKYFTEFSNKIENLLVISDLQDIPEKPNIVIIVCNSIFKTRRI